jgi:hypothetical protein
MLIELREELISQPGLTTKKPKDRTPLEDVAIKITAWVDKNENNLGG